MKKLIPVMIATVLSVAFTSTIQAEHHKVELSEHLKPLKWITGTWVLEYENEEGVKVIREESFTPSVSGHVINRTLKVFRDGELANKAQTTIYYNISKQKIMGLTVNSNGLNLISTYAVSNSEIVIDWHGTSLEGKKYSGKVVRESVDQNSHKAHQLDRVYDGEKVDDNKDVIFTRKK